jgi:hypothetical protein
VNHQRYDGEEQQQMNQAAGYMKHKKTASPENEQQQRNHEEGSKSHFRLLNVMNRQNCKTRSRNTSCLYGWQERRHIGKRL